MVAHLEKRLGVSAKDDDAEAEEGAAGVVKVVMTGSASPLGKSVTIDWTLRESARAKIRVVVKNILNKYRYPPDLQEVAVKTVLAQAELLCANWPVAI